MTKHIIPFLFFALTSLGGWTQNNTNNIVQQQTQLPQQNTTPDKKDCPECERIKELQRQKNQFYSPGFEVKYKNRTFKRKFFRFQRKLSYLFSKPQKTKVNLNCFAWK